MSHNESGTTINTPGVSGELNKDNGVLNLQVAPPNSRFATMTYTTTMTVTVSNEGGVPAALPYIPPPPPAFLTNWMGNNVPFINQPYQPSTTTTVQPTITTNNVTPSTGAGNPVVPNSTPRKRTSSILIGLGSISRKGNRLVSESEAIHAQPVTKTTAPTTAPATLSVPLPKGASSGSDTTNAPLKRLPSDSKSAEVEEADEEYEYEYEEEEYEESEAAGVGSKGRQIVLQSRSKVDTSTNSKQAGEKQPELTAMSRKHESFLPRLMALYEYKGRNEDELSFRPGDTIIVYEKDEVSGWWRGRVAGSEQEVGEDEFVVQIASFPYNYTKPIKPVLRMASNISPKILQLQIQIAELQAGGLPDDTYAVIGPAKKEAPQSSSTSLEQTSTTNHSDLLAAIEEMELLTSQFDFDIPESSTPTVDLASLSVDQTSALQALDALRTLSNAESAPVSELELTVDHQTVFGENAIVPTSLATTAIQEEVPSSPATIDDCATYTGKLEERREIPNETTETAPTIATPTYFTENQPTTPELLPPQIAQSSYSTESPASSYEIPKAIDALNAPQTTPVSPTIELTNNSSQTPANVTYSNDNSTEAIDIFEEILDTIEPPKSHLNTQEKAVPWLPTATLPSSYSPLSSPSTTTDSTLYTSPREASPASRNVMLASARSINTQQVRDGLTNTTNDRLPASQIRDRAVTTQTEGRKRTDARSRRPTWIPDEAYINCMLCKSSFSLLNRRHHCRKCGKLVCTRCCAHKMPLPHLGYTNPQSVCNSCAIELAAFNI